MQARRGTMVSCIALSVLAGWTPLESQLTSIPPGTALASGEGGVGTYIVVKPDRAARYLSTPAAGEIAAAIEPVLIDGLRGLGYTVMPLAWSEWAGRSLTWTNKKLIAEVERAGIAARASDHGLERVLIVFLQATNHHPTVVARGRSFEGDKPVLGGRAWLIVQSGSQVVGETQTWIQLADGLALARNDAKEGDAYGVSSAADWAAAAGRTIVEQIGGR